ncbi:MAG: ECF transporter S component [Oscillospiraceae bacterium]|nr:ECF transporter S component [Oscillospiraceae bacterium]
MSNTSEKTRMLAFMGILTAIVAVLQWMASVIAFGPFSITLALSPIIIGAAMYDWKAGAWLGTVFGIVVLLTNATAFLEVSIPATIVVCILKGALAGAAAAAVYKVLEKKNTYLAVMAAAIVCPVVNTGVFLLGCLVFFYNTVSSWVDPEKYSSVLVYMILGLVGVNFLVELVTNLFLSTVIVRILNIIKKPSVQAST